MDLGLRGLKALVSGGTKGIGRAIVDTLAAEGAHVALCARQATEVDATRTALRAQGATVVGRALDVGDAPALQAWVTDAARELGGLDIVIANVSALAIPSTEDNWRKEFEVDLMHTVRMVTTAMPYLEQSLHPAIVTIASVSGREIDFAAGPYGTFKAALIHWPVWHFQSRPHPLHPGPGLSTSQQGHPREHGLTREHVFSWRRVAADRARQSAAL